VPDYYNLTPKDMSYEEGSQWNEMDMKEIRWYQVGVANQSLRGGSPAQHPIFNCATECTRALLEFYLYAQYTSHNDATLWYMEDAFQRVHTFKDVILLVQAGKMARTKDNALRTDLSKKQKVDMETNTKTAKLSNMQSKLNTWRNYISHKIEISKKLKSDFNFPNIHLMSHWAEQIRRCRALQQYPAKRHDQVHKTKLKDGWNASNHNLNYLQQGVTIQCCILCFEIRELKLHALA
jgi:hypothetical protein